MDNRNTHILGQSQDENAAIRVLKIDIKLPDIIDTKNESQGESMFGNKEFKYHYGILFEECLSRLIIRK